MLALALLFDAVLVAVGVFALIRGGRPEKLGAVVNLVAVIASSALRVSGLASWAPGGATLIVDAMVTVSFYWLAFRTKRFWPIWCFGFALAVIMFDVVKLLQPDVGAFAFGTAQAAYAYLALGALVLGTVRASRSEPDLNHGFRAHAD